eukprot:GHVS01009917.1.p1 GENE.GHVS01009917.1~~GHVS01009917.1.p1  ORF type:complete len:289 (+),score=35.38 GHVS01009917.1:77-943(+)
MRITNSLSNRTTCRRDCPYTGRKEDPSGTSSSTHHNGPSNKSIVRAFSTNTACSIPSSVDVLSSAHSTTSAVSDKGSPPRRQPKAKAAFEENEVGGNKSTVQFVHDISELSIDPGRLQGEKRSFRQSRRMAKMDENDLQEEVRKGQERLTAYAALSKQLSKLYMECAEENDVTTAAEVAEAMEKLDLRQQAMVDSLLEARYCLGEEDSGALYSLEKPYESSKSLLASFLRRPTAQRQTEHPRSQSTKTIAGNKPTGSAFFKRFKPTTLFSSLRTSLPTLWKGKVDQIR